MDMDAEAILKGLVRIGTVTAVDHTNRLARVKYQDSGLISDWLHVLASRPYIPDYSGAQRTEYEEGGSGWPQYENHKHDLIIKPWMPQVNAVVLCLYLPVCSADGADGFILGELGPMERILQ